MVLAIPSRCGEKPSLPQIDWLVLSGKAESLQLVQLLKDARDRQRGGSIHTQFFALVILLRELFFLGMSRISETKPRKLLTTPIVTYARAMFARSNSRAPALSACLYATNLGRAREALPYSIGLGRGFRDAWPLFRRGKLMIFDLTHAPEAASCRPCCLNQW